VRRFRHAGRDAQALRGEIGGAPGVTLRAALAVWTLALACVAAAIVLVASGDHTDGKVAVLALAVPTGLAFVASGIVARLQRPQNRTGLLLILVGFSWFLGALSAANDPYLFTAGLVLGNAFTALLAHLFLAFPTGRLITRADRAIAAAFYGVVLIGPLLAYVLDEGDLTEAVCDGPCPDNVVAAVPAQSAAAGVAVGYGVAAAALALLVLVRMAVRWRRASPALRRALSPVLATAGLLIALAVAQTIVSVVSADVAEATNWLVLGALLAVPLAFLYGLLRSRFGATTRRLVAELSEKRTPEEVQAVMRHALRDQTLELGYWSGEGFLGVDGRPLQLPGPHADRAVTHIGEAVVVHDASLQDQPELDEVVDAARIALERGLSLRSLEDSERRARAVLDAIPDHVYRLSADGVFLDPPSLVGRRLDEVLPEGGDVVLAGVRRALAANEVVSVEYQFTEANEVRAHEARIAPSGGDEVVGIVRDVTDRKRQENDLRLFVEEQAALNRVAVTVATETAAQSVFDVVTEEVARLLGADAANLVRFTGKDEGVIVGKWSEPGVPIPGSGTVNIPDGSALSRVMETGAPARMATDDPGVDPELHERLTALGVTSLVAAPIVVAGDIWGAVVVSVTTGQEFAAEAESRIGKFAGLVAVALANTQARTELRALAEEQAALSRVALAVATETTSGRVFDVVTEEVARLFGSDAANLVRFTPDRHEAVVVGRWRAPGIEIEEVGATIPLDGGPVTEVARTGAPARASIDDPGAPASLRQRLARFQLTSLVAGPVVVSGDLWGAVVVSARRDQQLAPNAEERLGAFAKLVAVAVSNAHARDELAALADEQAALSRVAVAVATEQQPERLFNTVSEELGRLFGAGAAATVRYIDEADEVEFVGGWRQDDRFGVYIGPRKPIQGGAIERVRETGRTARIDLENEPPDVQEHMVARNVSSGVAAPIVVSGRLWGATSISAADDERFPPDAEERLEKFTSLVAVALANAEAREELTASRARIVQAGDAERRRLERNLHDGAQQRLVTLALGLRLAQSRLPADPAGAAELIESAREELQLSLAELRELARGIHPAILSDRGLTPALESLAGRATVPVEVNGLPPERLPEPIEAAAFYVVSESLANVGKYAAASRCRVELTRDDGVLVVEVSDDGVGGADAGKGSGLRGLSDRVEALGGRLRVLSEQGLGTTVRAELPLG
jgi:signal transduction histidine kinase/PAS domain-containing protein